MIDTKAIEKLGLQLKDFQPQTDEDKDRLSDLEDAVIELAEIISEVMDNG